VEHFASQWWKRSKSSYCQELITHLFQEAFSDYTHPPATLTVFRNYIPQFMLFQQGSQKKTCVFWDMIQVVVKPVVKLGSKGGKSYMSSCFILNASKI
jgi:hypothetical protein